MKRELFSFLLMLVMILPTGYYIAGRQVYDAVAATNTDCWGNFDQNTPESFAPLRHEIAITNATDTENITTDIMENISQYWWPGHQSTFIEVPDEDLSLSAWYYVSNASAPWVIFVHGIRGCKAGGSILLPAGMLINSGFNVMTFDMRDHGQSSIEDNRVSAGQKEWRDVIAVHDWLIENEGAKVGQIGLFGTSMGAGAAAITFSLEPRIQSVWLDSGFSDMGLIIEEELAYQGLPAFLSGAGIFAGKIATGEDLVQHSPLLAASEIGDRHMYVVHGKQDPRVMVHHGEKMCELAKENAIEGNVECWIKDSIIRYDVGEGLESDQHVSLMLSDTDEYESRLISFFESSLY